MTVAAMSKGTFLLPTSLLAGAIIGAGMFSLPYVAAQVGIVLGLALLAIITLIVSILHLLYADVVTRTPGTHNFVGYLRRYLGELPAWVGIFISTVELPIVLVIYLLLSKSFSALLWTGADAASAEWLVILFWLSGSLAVFWNIKEMAKVQLLVTAAMIAIAAIIFFFGLGHGTVSLPHVDLRGWDWLLPIGPLLFALGGRIAIVEVVRYFRPGRPAKLIRRAVLWGTIIPALVYGAFIIGTLALTSSPTEDSVSGLVPLLPPALRMLLGILGLFVLWTSYIAIVFDVRDTLIFDFRVPEAVMIIFLIFTPIALYYTVGHSSFIALISFVGGFFLTLEGIFIVWMWRQADTVLPAAPRLLPRPHASVIASLILILGVALLYEVWKIFALIISRSL